MPFNTNAWNRARYTVWSPFYDRVASFSKQRRRSIALLELKPGQSVLLSGAGTGADLEYLPRGVRITAVDITPAMVARSASRAQRLGIDATTEVADAQQLPYADNSFDAVVLHLIVAVAPDGGRVMAEAARVLRPGGKAVVFDKFVADGNAPSVARRLVNVITSTLFSDVTRQLGPLIQRAGFQLVRREPAGLGGRFEIALLRKP